MTSADFHANINDNIINALHEEGYASAHSEDASIIVSVFYKGKDAVGAHRIDKGNKGVSVWMTEGKNRDNSLVIHISDFKSGGMYKCKNVWKGDYPKRDRSFKEDEKSLSLRDFTYPSPDEWRDEDSLPNKLIDKLKKKVPLINEYALRDVENSPVVIAYKDGLCRVLARSLSIDGLFRGELSFCEEKFSGMWPNRDQWAKNSCGKIKDDSGAYLHGGIFVICGEILSSKHAILCEGLATSLTAQIAIERTAALLEMGICVVFAQGHANLDATDKTLRRISPDIRVFYHDEGSGLSLSCVGISSLLSRDKNHDWNDDIHKMISDGASVEAAYIRLGKHILDGMNSSLALKEEEKPEKELGDTVEPEDFASEIGASLNVSLLPYCMSKILSDVLAFREMSQGVGISSLLCFIGGVVGHRVKRSYCKELPFLYVCCIGGVGSGKSYRFNSLQNDVFNNKIRDFFDTEFVQTNANRNLIEICEKMYHQLFCSKRTHSDMSDEEEELNNFLDSIKKETSQNSLYNNRGELYANRCLKDTYKQLFNNKIEIKNKSIAEEGALELDHLASGFSALFLDQFSGNATNSLVMIKTLFLLCPSVCFYYDELSKFFEAEKSEALAVQREYILSMYESGGTKNSLSRGCANIKNYIDSTLFMIGNLTTGEFFSDLVRGKMFDKLNKKGFFGRTLLCEDKSPRKTTEQLYSERNKEAFDKNEEAFSLLAKTLIGIEDSFRNPVEFLAGHIRIPMEDEIFLKKSISSVSYWSDLYSKEGSDYSEGSVGRALLENFIGRIHSVYNSIYALMFLLFAGEDFCMENSVERFSSQDPFNINSNSSQNFMKLFNQRKGLHRFVTERNVERASLAADEAFNFLMRNDFSVRAEVARRVNPYKSSDLECARAIYSRLEEGEMDWCRPVIVETPYMKIASHYVNTSKMASQCSWLNVPDKRGFYSAAIGKKNAIEDFFDRNSFLVKDFYISDSNSSTPVVTRKSLGDMDEEEMDFAGKIFLKIRRTSRKGHRVYAYIFNFFNRELVLEELCGRFSLPVTQIKPNGSRVVFIGKKGKEKKNDDKKLARKR